MRVALFSRISDAALRAIATVDCRTRVNVEHLPSPPIRNGIFSGRLPGGRGQTWIFGPNCFYRQCTINSSFEFQQFIGRRISLAVLDDIWIDK